MTAAPGSIVVALDLQEKWIQKVRGSKILYLDPTWHPEAAMRTDAVVVAIPKTMPTYQDIPVLKINDPLYDKSVGRESSPEHRRKMSFAQFYSVADIYPEVEVGDRVILHYVALDYDLAFIHEGQYMLKIPYSFVFACVKPRGEIRPIGGWVFLLEVDPDPARYDGPLIIPKGALDKERDYRLGMVVEIGKNIGGKPTEVERYQIYLLPKKGHWIEYQAVKYLVVQQDDLAALKTLEHERITG